jgi:hypothetical protein
VTSVAVVGDKLIVEPQGWHRLWSLRRRIEVPVTSVRSARVDPTRPLRPRGPRMPGTYWSGRIAAGTYRWKGYKAFWDVSNRQNVVTIELDVPEPAATVAAVAVAMRRR